MLTGFSRWRSSLCLPGTVPRALYSPGCVCSDGECGEGPDQLRWLSWKHLESVNQALLELSLRHPPLSFSESRRETAQIFWLLALFSKSIQYFGSLQQLLCCSSGTFTGSFIYLTVLQHPGIEGLFKDIISSLVSPKYMCLLLLDWLVRL